MSSPYHLREIFTKQLTKPFNKERIDNFSADYSIKPKPPDELFEISEHVNSSTRHYGKKLWKLIKNENDVVVKAKTQQRRFSTTPKNQISEKRNQEVLAPIKMKTSKVIRTSLDDLLDENRTLKAKCAEYEKTIETLKKGTENSELDTSKAADAPNQQRRLTGGSIDAQLISLFKASAVDERDYEKEIKDLKEEIHNGKEINLKLTNLFEQEKQKNKIFSDQLQTVDDLIQLFEHSQKKNKFTDEKADLVKSLIEKNNKMFDKLVQFSDQVYEKNLEYALCRIHQLDYQKSQIIEELKKYKEQEKELTELREHLSTLINVIRNLRQGLKNVATAHKTEDAHGNEPKARILNDINAVADQAKNDLISKLFSGNNKMRLSQEF